MFKLLVIFLIIIFILLFHSKKLCLHKNKNDRNHYTENRWNEIKVCIKNNQDKSHTNFFKQIFFLEYDIGEKAEHNKQQMIKDFLKFAKTGKVDFHSWF